MVYFKFIGVLVIWLFLVNNVHAQNNNKANRITGKWLTKEEKARIKIYQCNGDEYCGKIIWTKNHAEGKPPERDDNNPDPDKRDRKILGLTILTNLKYNAEEEIWEDGTIYDPERGKEYNCYVKLTNPDKLKLRGYVGFSMLGRSSYWTRIE